MPSFETKRVLQTVEELERVGRTLRDMPELQPVARRMLGVIWGAPPPPTNGANGVTKRRKKHWTQTPAGRKRMTEIIRARKGKK
jgi:hypothetical protein